MKKQVVVIAALVALVGASLASAARPTAADAPAVKTTVVTVSMYEMGFKLSKRIVPRGIVSFRVVNDGQIDHDFRVRGRGTPMLGAGERATLNIRFTKAGRFSFICTVEGHAGAGMVGKLVVK